MILFLSIHYDTRWGDQLFVTGNFEAKDKNSKYALTYLTDGLWQAQIAYSNTSLIRYKYHLKTWDGKEIAEPVFRYFTGLQKKAISVCDQWLSPVSIETIFFKSAFKNAIFRRENVTQNRSFNLKNGVNFSISVPNLKKGEKLCVSGSIPQLGNWNIYEPLILETGEFAHWLGGFDECPTTHTFEYKYAIWDLKKRQIVHWESGDNRKTCINPNHANLIGDANFRFDTQWKGAGISIPVFSLRTKTGLGIGEFNDLKLMADWAQSTGMNIIQILPVNDTISRYDWTDSYPYNSISVYALNPIYIYLDELFKHDHAILDELQSFKNTLNALPEIDFERILKLKFEYLRKAFSYHYPLLNDDKDYQAFYNRNAFWLNAYAVFCFLRDTYKTTNFKTWEENASYSEKLISEFTDPQSPYFKDVMFYVFVQYHLDKQLSSAVEHIRKCGLALKGDIPIGINRESVDAWASSELFNFDQQTGAPPDYFSQVGQNWGFPTYNWDMMKKDSFEWWRKRFGKMADYFDAYRIDHILGFFRIWEIPYKYNEGLMGHFSPALPYTIEEIRAKGIPFEPKWWCTPHLYEDEASEFFGKDMDKIVGTFFYRENDIYYLKNEYQSTREIEKWCNKHGITSSGHIEKLREIVCDVLFMEDEKTKGHYHPRIELQRTRKYNKLDEWARHLLNNLYNDFFFRRHNAFWKEQALKKLPQIIDSTNMLACGEDLGMVPANVPEVMNALKIFTLDIQTMPKVEGIEFSDPRNFDYLSICTTSTHDTPTLRGIWKYDPAKGRRLLQSFSQNSVDWTEECPGWVCKQILEVNLRAGSMFTILPFQDWLSLNEQLRHPDAHAERINKPEFSRHYWRYRMHITIEELLSNHGFSDEIQHLINASGR